jgi:GTP cyclohydrolase II
VPPSDADDDPDSLLVRVHDSCFTSELFGSVKCDCKQQLDAALVAVQAAPRGGAVIYLLQEGRGIGLANKIAAYALQESGHDTVDANRALGLPDDAREYGAVRDILSDLGVAKVALLTNNPRKVRELDGLGVTVVRRVGHVLAAPSELAANYMRVKAARMGHAIAAGDITHLGASPMVDGASPTGPADAAATTAAAAAAAGSGGGGGGGGAAPCCPFCASEREPFFE